MNLILNFITLIAGFYVNFMCAFFVYCVGTSAIFPCLLGFTLTNYILYNVFSVHRFDLKPFQDMWKNYLKELKKYE